MPILRIKFFSVDFIYFKTKRKPDRLFVGEEHPERCCASKKTI